MHFCYLVRVAGWLFVGLVVPLFAQIDCVSDIPHEMQVQHAGAIFYGRLIGIRVVEEAVKKRERFEMTFRREEIWKGPKTPLLRAVGFSSFSFCTGSYPFQPQKLRIGVMYLVYAQAPFNFPNLPTGNPLRTEFSIGSDSALYEDADKIGEQRRLLGRGYVVPVDTGREGN